MPFLSKNSHKSITFEHHNTYVSLERPFFRLAVLAASVWAPFSSSSSKFPSVNVTGFIILSAVSLVNTRSICRARWKSAGPKGRPGSKDGKVKENVINFVTKSHELTARCIPIKDVVFCCLEGVPRCDGGENREEDDDELPHPRAGPDSHCPSQFSAFQSVSCQKPINISFDHFASAAKKEGRCSKIQPV